MSVTNDLSSIACANINCASIGSLESHWECGQCGLRYCNKNNNECKLYSVRIDNEYDTMCHNCLMKGEPDPCVYIQAKELYYVHKKLSTLNLYIK